MERQKIQEIIEVRKRQTKSESQPTTQVESEFLLEAQPVTRTSPIVRRSPPLDSASQSRPQPKPSSPPLKQPERVGQSVKQVENEFELPDLPVSHLESLEVEERWSPSVPPSASHSLFNSGWEYSQLLKELRD